MSTLTLGESIRTAVAMLEGDLSKDVVAAVIMVKEWTAADAMQLLAGFAVVAHGITIAAGTERASAVFAQMRALGDQADQGSSAPG